MIDQENLYRQFKLTQAKLATQNLVDLFRIIEIITLVPEKGVFLIDVENVCLPSLKSAKEMLYERKK